MNRAIAELPAAIQLQLERTHIAADCPGMAVVKASGKRLLEYLQGQITQDIRLLGRESGIYACVLTPQGKPVADLHAIWAETDTVLMLVERTYAVNLVGRLRQFMLGYELRIGVVDNLSAICVQGPEADAALLRAGLPVPEQAHYATACQPETEIFAIRIPEAAASSIWLVLPLPSARDCLDRLDNTAGEHEMEAVRILHGRPRFGVDWDEHVYPLNANLIERQGVSFDKGCYTGQEVTSRMHWRKAIKWRLYRVRPGNAPACIPCPVLASAKAGALTSLARNAEGELFGIAHLRIEAAAPGSPLMLEDGTTVSLVE